MVSDLSLSVENADAGVTSVTNGGVESGEENPDNWWFGSGDYNAFKFNWNDAVYSSPYHSLEITSKGSGDKFAFWAQTISAEQVVGKSITVNVKAKTSDFSGNGVYVAIRGDDTLLPYGSAEVFKTTQNIETHTGDFDWTTISVTLDSVPANIKSITVYLLYGTETAGTVYFDDLTMDVK